MDKQSKIIKPLLLASSISLLTAYTYGKGSSPSAATDAVAYTNGYIYTVDGNRSVAQAMIVENGEFIKLGSNKAIKKIAKLKNYPIESLKGKMVLPGLHDTHIHPWGAVPVYRCNLDNQERDLDQLSAFIQNCIAEYIREEGDWLIVTAWPISGNEPTATHSTIRAALDAAAPNNPVVLRGNDGHASAYNSAALALAEDEDGNTVGYTTESLGAGGVFQHLALYVDLSTGVIRDEGKETMPEPPPQAEDFLAIVPDVAEYLASNGLTSIQEAKASSGILTLYQAMDEMGMLTSWVHAAQNVNVQRAIDNGLISFTAEGINFDGLIEQLKERNDSLNDTPNLNAKYVKIFADGVLEGNPFSSPLFFPNAGMLENYQAPTISGRTFVADSVDSGNNGIVNYPQGFLNAYVTALDAADFGVHIHAIGDRTVRTAINAFEVAQNTNGDTDNPQIIAHLQMVHPDDQQRIADLDIYTAYTPAWAAPYPEYDILVTPFTDASNAGQDLLDFLYDPNGYRWRANYPIKSTSNANGNFVIGSDAPVDTSDPRPFINMYAAVTRNIPDPDYPTPYNSDEAIELEEAIEAYTINGAKALQQADITGSIEVGKKADFIVINKNLFKLRSQNKLESMGEVKVLKTYFEGELIYDAAK